VASSRPFSEITVVRDHPLAEVTGQTQRSESSDVATMMYDGTADALSDDGRMLS
jgi:hypothetical protein